MPRKRREYKIPYPMQARQLGIEGTIKLDVLVGETGQVKQARIRSGPGFGLNEAAQKALLKFLFDPAIDAAGKPIPCWMPYSYTFQIDS
jgi:TonB family protein